MPLRRTATVLAVDREVTGPEGARERIALSATFAGADGAAEPSAEELRAALARLRGELDTLVAADGGGSRAIEELVETYRPRQRELVDLLEADGEINAAEANLLLAYLADGPTGAKRPEASPLPGPTERPIAALPLSVDRAPSVARPVPQLLAEFRIETLKQAGAVRARRQISYEEYMALKRHFSVAPVPAGSEGHPPQPG